MFKKFIKLLLASLFFFSVSSTTFAMDKLHFLIGGGAGDETYGGAWGVVVRAAAAKRRRWVRRGGRGKGKGVAHHLWSSSSR